MAQAGGDGGGVDHAAGEFAPRAAELFEGDVAVGEFVEVEVEKRARAAGGETHGEDFFVGGGLEEEKARELAEQDCGGLAHELAGGVALGANTSSAAMHAAQVTERQERARN